MKISPISEWVFYRHRYAIGYVLLAVLVALYIALYPGLIPPGLGTLEQQSVVTSARISFSELPVAIIDLPYHLLQKLSVEWLGVTPYGVRLPSYILGTLTAIFVALVMRRWFPHNVAVVAGLLALSLVWFIGTARLGTPAIMIPFWTSLIFLAATYISQQTKNWKWWKVMLAFAAALSLYTPFMSYLFVAAFIASLSQPHLRYLIRKSTSFQMTIGTFLFLLVLAPLGWGLYKDISQVWQLLAIPTSLPDPLQFGKDFLQAASNVFNPYNVSFGEVITPLLSLPATALLLMGGIRLFRDFHAVRSHVLLVWLAVLIPIIGFNPNNLIILLVPAMLVMAIGVQLTIRYWYRLFPRNPYARIFGLLPLALLVLALVQFNDSRYTFGMLYGEQAHKVFSADPFLARQTLAATDKSTPTTLVVPADKKELYQVMTIKHPNATVATATEAIDASGKWIVATSEVPKVALPLGAVSSVVVNSRATDSLRFVVYQR